MPQAAYINGWGGGLNKLLPAKDIADTELADAINVELTENQALRKRDGTALAHDGTTTPLSGSTVRGLTRYSRSSGANVLVFGYGADTLYRVTLGGIGSSSLTDISSSLVFDANADWQWAIMDDELFGVNGIVTSVSNINNIRIVDHASNAVVASATTGTFPEGKFITTFARRLWIVDQANPNQLHYSALGDARNWDTTAGAANAGSVVVGQDEGDHITGIMPYLGRLIIFKRTRIYMLVPGAPNTDNTQFNIVLLTDRLGCIDGKTIQQLLNDVVFLSDYGLASLTAAQEFGDLRQTILSHKLPEMAGMSSSSVYASTVNQEKRQYWLSDYTNNKVFVLDFSQAFTGGGMTWMIFDGDVVGASYADAIYNGDVFSFVGNSDLVVYTDTEFDDQDTTNTSAAFFRTKAYSMGEPLRRKDFFKFGVEFEAESDPVNFDITYRLDQDDARQKTVSGSFSSLVSGSLLDGPDVLDTSFKLATDVAEDTDLIWPIRGSKGRRAQTIQFIFNHSAASQGWIVKRMLFVFDFLRSLWGVGDYDAS